MSKTATNPSSSTESEMLLPQGLAFAGVACGIKASGKRDLALIVADRPCVAVCVTTTNQIVAAPVE
ncbi:MAG: bifunctional ornithine acetyltransferase/N-acetylglutamate synthase, partial [Planctomycetota bacterium]